MTDPEVMARARLLYIDKFPATSVHAARIERGEWDTAPNLQALIPQAEAELIRDRREAMDE